MKFIKKFLWKFKKLVLLINYKFFYSKTDSGYNNSELNSSIIKKTIIFSKNKSVNKKYDINYQRTVKFLEFIKKKKLKNIVDFGGGAGYHYFIAKMRLSGDNFKWQIIENNTMVKLCNKKFDYKNLFFFDSLKKIKKADIFFSSGAINYTNDPLYILKKISKLEVKYLYFTRTPLNNYENLTFNQLSLLSEHGPVKLKNENDMIICNKNKILNVASFENIFYKNFELIKRFVDEKNLFTVNKKKIDSYTYIYKRIKNSL